MYHVVKYMANLPRPLPQHIFKVKDMSKECLFHRFFGHSIGDCALLKDVLERMAREGKLTKYIRPDFYRRYTREYSGEKEFKKKIQYRRDYDGLRNSRPRVQNNQKEDPGPSTRQKSIDINVISGGHRKVAPKKHTRNRDDIRPYPSILNVEQAPERKRPRMEEAISFSEKDFGYVKWPHEDPIVLRLKIEEHRVNRVLVDTGSSADILYLAAFKKMGLQFSHLHNTTTPLAGFTGDTLQPRGTVSLKVTFGAPPRTTTATVDLLVVSVPSAYNAILVRSTH